MKTTLSSPLLFVVCLENDGCLMRSFFANSSCKVDNGTLLSGVSQLVNQFQPAKHGASFHENNLETHSAILALEAFLGRNHNDPAQPTVFTMSYDDIRNFDMLLDSTRRTQPPVFLRWLIENQLPVVHVVRKNVLDYFVARRVSGDVDSSVIPFVDVHQAVELIRQMQKDVGQFRNWLVSSNRIEFYSESLFDTDRKPSELVAHQLSIHLGLDSEELRPAELSDSAVGSQHQAAQIKSQLRPALIRAGYENLYQLPRAA